MSDKTAWAAVADRVASASHLIGAVPGVEQMARGGSIPQREAGVMIVSSVNIVN